MKSTESAIKDMITHIVGECDAADTDRMYDDMLNECYSLKSVGGIFACMSPSRVLRECDPTAYRCGKNDWLDAERDNLVEIGNDYFQVDDVNREQEAFIDGLRDELSALELEPGTNQYAIESKQAQIEACEKHAF